MTTEATPKAHLGRNVRHFRQEKDWNQDELADRMGEPWTQKKISQMEAKAVIEDSILEQVARALEVSVEEIKEYSEQQIVNNNVQYNYEGSHNQGANVGNNNLHCTFNPLDKLIESHENEKRLYEALLKEKEDKIALMERMMKEGKRD
jgi:transcriptional regulator with XRE-family HTH domain